MKHIHIGTSGWHYRHWKGAFYPGSFSPRDFLSFYARHFDTVEINNSFYSLPEKKTLEEWHRTTPAGFLFAVKGSRYITHMKKLKAPKPSTAKFFDRIKTLRDKLGPILFQLPPRWKFNRDRFGDFLKDLPPDYEYAFEFRDPTWFNEESYGLLRGFRMAFCIYELAGFISPEVVTSDLVYVRLHGPGAKYQGRYSLDILRSWARKILGWSKGGKDVYCYFDNDDSGFAAQNARELIELLEAAS